MLLRHDIDGVTYSFENLKDLLAKATPRAQETNLRASQRAVL